MAKSVQPSTSTTETAIATLTPFAQPQSFLQQLQRLWNGIRGHEQTLTLGDLDEAISPSGLILGKPGVGKSRLYEALFHAFADAQYSVLGIDRHEDSFTQCLYYCIKEGISPKDVIIVDFDPAKRHLGHPVFDPLLVPTGVDVDVVLDLVTSTLRGIAGGSNFGERMAEIGRYAFKALIEANLAITQVVPFLKDANHRAAVLARCNNPETLTYWSGVEKSAQMRNSVSALLSSLDFVLTHSLIKPFFDTAQYSVDLHDAFASGKKILISLKTQYFRDFTVSFLGGLFLCMSTEALFRRDPNSYCHPTRILLDEIAEYYIPVAIRPILTGLRKFGAGLLLFAQSLSSFPKEDVRIFFQTSGYIFVFNTSHEEATELAREMLVLPPGGFVKFRAWDLRGCYGPTEYWSPDQVRSHFISLLREQGIAEFIGRITKNQSAVSICTTVPVQKYRVSARAEERYRKESAAAHGPSTKAYSVPPSSKIKPGPTPTSASSSTSIGTPQPVSPKAKKIIIP